MGNGTLLERAILRPVAVSTTYTARPFDLIIADCSGGSFTVTLPTGHAPGDPIGIRLDVGSSPVANTVTLARDGSNTIDGATSVILFVVGDYLEVAWTGSKWTRVIDRLQPHVAIMHNTAAQSISGTLGTTTLAFDTEDFDNAGIFDLTSDTATIRRAGNYEMKLRIRTSAAMDDNEVVYAWILVGSSTVSIDSDISAGASQILVAQPSILMPLAASDVVTFQATSNEGAVVPLITTVDGWTMASICERR